MEKYHILFIDDNPGDQRLIHEILKEDREASFEIEFANSLGSGIETLGEKLFDVVLLDLNLPDSSGIETLMQILGLVTEIPVVVITGQDDEDLADEALRRGAQDYQVKGRISGSTMVRAIRYAIGRNKIERELRKSEERFRTLFEHAPDGYYLLGSSGEFIDGNKAAEEMAGYKKEELLGKKFFEIDLLTPESLEKAVRHFQNNIAGRAAGPDEVTLVRKDGTFLPVEIRTHPIKIRDQDVILGVARDVSERKKAEEEIKRMNYQLEERVKELGCLYRVSTLLSSVDIPMTEILKCIVEFVPSAFRCPEDTSARLTVEGMEFSTDNFKESGECMSAAVSKKNDEIGLLEVSCERGKSEGGETIFQEEERKLLDAVAKKLGVAIELKNAEEALKESESRLQRILSTTPDGFFVVNAQNARITKANSAFCDMLGYNEAEMLTLRISDIEYKKTHEEISRHIETIMRQGSDRFETVHRRKDGSPVDVEVSVSFLEGKEPDLVVFVRDITERKRAEEALRVFRKALENSTDAIGMSTPQGRHYYQNKAFDQLFGDIGEHPPDTVYVEKKVGEEVFQRIMSGGQWKGEIQMYAKDKRILDIDLRAYANMNEDGNIMSIVGIHTDITERKRSEAEREQLIRDLQRAMTEIKTLGGLVPICSSCKKIRDDGGYWNQLEAYLQQHSYAEFTHSICPECEKKLYPDEDDSPAEETVEESGER